MQTPLRTPPQLQQLIMKLDYSTQSHVDPLPTSVYLVSHFASSLVYGSGSDMTSLVCMLTPYNYLTV